MLRTNTQRVVQPVSRVVLWDSVWEKTLRRSFARLGSILCDTREAYGISYAPTARTTFTFALLRPSRVSDREAINKLILGLADGYRGVNLKA
jgi:hypothetical protein